MDLELEIQRLYFGIGVGLKAVVDVWKQDIDLPAFYGNCFVGLIELKVAGSFYDEKHLEERMTMQRDMASFAVVVPTTPVQTADLHVFRSLHIPGVCVRGGRSGSRRVAHQSVRIFVPRAAIGQGILVLEKYD
jgi:hypothetical protein